MLLCTGEVVGSYRLVQQLGSGAQGSVWKGAHVDKAGVCCALKLLQLGGMGPQDAERIRREGRLLGTLHHASLARCRQIIEDNERDLLALVMDLIEGDALSNLVRDDRLSTQHRDSVLLHVAGALAYLHRSRVLHRDLKLENVLIRSGFWEHPDNPGNVVLVDFGIAALLGNPQPLTQTGKVIGTLPYMPPEVLDPTLWPGPTDVPAADVFAFGVFGWLLLCGEHPTGLPTSATITDLARAYDAVRRAERPWPQRPVGSWGATLQRCAALAVSERLSDGQAILDDLAGAARALRARTEEHVSPPQWGKEHRSQAAAQVEPHRATSAQVPPDTPAPRLLQRPTAPAQGATLGYIHSLAAPAGSKPTRPTTRALLPVLLGTIALVVAVVLLALGAARTIQTAQRGPTTWTDQLTASECSSPCCGGSLCAEKPKDCGPTRYTCVPGVCETTLASGESWELHLSGVSDRGADACKTSLRTNGVVCVRPSGTSPNWTCESIEDACSHGGMSTEWLSITTDTLTRSGIDIEVRPSAMNATVLARRYDAKHKDGLQRVALCKGVKFDGLSNTAGSDIRYVTFYLRPK